MNPENRDQGRQAECVALCSHIASTSSLAASSLLTRLLSLVRCFFVLRLTGCFPSLFLVSEDTLAKVRAHTHRQTHREKRNSKKSYQTENVKEVRQRKPPGRKPKLLVVRERADSETHGRQRATGRVHSLGIALRPSPNDKKISSVCRWLSALRGCISLEEVVRVKRPFSPPPQLDTHHYAFECVRVCSLENNGVGRWSW